MVLFRPNQEIDMTSFKVSRFSPARRASTLVPGLALAVVLSFMAGADLQAHPHETPESRRGEHAPQSSGDESAYLVLETPELSTPAGADDLVPSGSVADQSMSEQNESAKNLGLWGLAALFAAIAFGASK